MAIKIILTLLFSATYLNPQLSQASVVKKDPVLSMTFPSIYFKHNSTEYAVMPYAVDSCYEYIADHVKYLDALTLWRDSNETEQLTSQRLKKIRTDLKKHTKAIISIKNMGDEQKISQRTINAGNDTSQRQFLLTLNSVLDVSGTVRKKPKYHCLICRLHAQAAEKKK